MLIYRCLFHFNAAKLPNFSVCFLYFCVCLLGRGQAGSKEGSKGGGQRDPHEGAGEATKRGIHGENTSNAIQYKWGCDARLYRKPCYAATTGSISWVMLVLCWQFGPPTFPVKSPFAVQGGLSSPVGQGSRDVHKGQFWALLQLECLFIIILEIHVNKPRSASFVWNVTNSWCVGQKTPFVLYTLVLTDQSPQNQSKPYREPRRSVFWCRTTDLYREPQIFLMMDLRRLPKSCAEEMLYLKLKACPEVYSWLVTH